MIRSISIVLALVVTMQGCSKKKENNDNEKDKNSKLLLLSLLITPWTQVIPSAPISSITIKSKTFNYSAQCSGQSASGTQNSQFYYFVRPGDSKKLLINFMGGGACWNLSNCFGTNTTTYFNSMSLLNATTMKFAFGSGVVDNMNIQNPLTGYTVIFIPYCTGDLHWGSNDTIYNPATNTFTGNTNSGGILHHRGFDNFLAVLTDLKKNYPSPTNVFITGQSAGGYGAMFTAPYIIEAMGGYGGATDYVLVSDASAGVAPSSNNTTVAPLWGITAGISKAGGSASNLPDWISGITDSSFSTLQVGQFFQRIAQNYPSLRIGQYSTIYDITQSFFLNVSRIVRDNANFVYTDSATDSGTGKCATLWGNANNVSGGNYSGCSANVTPGLVNLWKNGGTDPTNSTTINGMITNVTTYTSGLSNYTYYIAPGPVHTISTNSNFYQTTSSGTALTTWYSDLVNKKVPASVQCSVNCSCGSGTDSAKCAPSGSN